MNIRDYKLGFSFKGLLAFGLVMMPNILWMLAPPRNDVLAGNVAPNPVVEIVMRICQWALVATLIILVNQKTKRRPRTKVYAALAVACLMGYWAMWAAYYLGVVEPLVFLGLAVFPSLCFCFASLWVENYIALVLSIIFRCNSYSRYSRKFRLKLLRRILPYL